MFETFCKFDFRQLVRLSVAFNCLGPFAACLRLSAAYFRLFAAYLRLFAAC